MDQKRLVKCDKCAKRYTFVAPTKSGYYKIACPKCKAEKVFKVQ